jgi:voltage-gated potassium channel
VLSVARPGDVASQVFDATLVALIILNVVAICLETVSSIAAGHDRYFRAFETFSVVAFSIEYVLRVWAAVEEPRFARPLIGRLKFMATPMAIIDLLAVAPFYIPAILPVDLRVLRTLRLLRIVRLLKLGRYSKAMQTIGHVLHAKRQELLMTAFVVLILLLIGSAGVYHAEHAVQPEAFSSIPATLWWGITTLSTVGYGDVVPVTPLGKLIGAMVALLGIGMFALPAGILGSAFVEELRRERQEAKKCPHCGKEL